MALERPQVVQAALERNWEIVAHNYVQSELLTDNMFDEDAEREVIRATLKVYEEFCGYKAKGWLSSSLRSTLNTIDILAEEGLFFICDLLNDDQPYMVETRSGKPMVSVSYTSEVNDFSFLRQGLGAEGGLQMFKEQFDWLYAESATTGKFMNVGLHPTLSASLTGSAHCAILSATPSNLTMYGLPRVEIAAWYMQNHASHIEVD